MSVHIVDESLPRREQAMNIQIFRDEVGNMPKILVGGGSFKSGSVVM